jgi:hypothetical protein
VVCVPLYSALPPAEQQKVFDPAPEPRVKGGPPGAYWQRDVSGSFVVCLPENLGEASAEKGEQSPRVGQR